MLAGRVDHGAESVTTLRSVTCENASLRDGLAVLNGVWEGHTVPLTGTAGLLLPARSSACGDLITTVAARLELRADEIGEEIADLLKVRVTELAAHPELKQDLLDVCHASVRLLTAMARTWADPAIVSPPQDTLSWARSLVDHGVRAETLLRVFHLGQARYQAIWHAELRRTHAPSDLLVETYEVISAFVFTWVDAICGPLIDTYTEEMDRRLRDVSAVREAELDRILADEPIDQQAAGARLGYDLGGEHVAVVLWLRSDAAPRTQRELESLLSPIVPLLVPAPRGRPLISRRAMGVIRAWIAGVAGEMVREPLDDLLRDAGACLAVGTAGVGVTGFRRSADEAQRARRVAGLLHSDASLTCFADVAVEDLLTRDLDTAKAFARRSLGELAGDSDSAQRLLGTLRCFYGEHQSLRQAAQRLGIHENTVGYRIRRAAELAGHADPGSWELRVAASLAPLIRENVDCL